MTDDRKQYCNIDKYRIIVVVNVYLGRCSNFVICVWEPDGMEPLWIGFKYLSLCEAFYSLYNTLIGAITVVSQRNIDYKYLNKFKFND